MQQHQSASRTLAPWLWELGAGRVRTIRAATFDRWLMVDGGRVWLTQTGLPDAPVAAPGALAADASADAPPDLPRWASADHWLDAGERLLLPAGTGWLIEAVALPEAEAGVRTDLGASGTRVTGPAARLALWLPPEQTAAPTAAAPRAVARAAYAAGEAAGELSARAWAWLRNRFEPSLPPWGVGPASRPWLARPAS